MSLLAVASGLTTLAPQGNNIYADLSDYITKAGGSINKVAISEIKGLRGVTATRDIKKDEVVVRCPSVLGLALTDPFEPAQDRNEALVEAGFNLMQWFGVECDEVPYISTLPTLDYQFTPTPDFWDDEHIEAMEFRPAIKAAKKRRKIIREVAEDEGVDEQQLRFATWLVTSRTFNILVDDEEEDEKRIRVCIPFIDMLNHALDPNCDMVILDEDEDSDEAIFALQARYDIPAGSQLFLNYDGPSGGEATSFDLLLDYGVCLGSGTNADPGVLSAYQSNKEPLFTTPRQTTKQHLNDFGHRLHPNLRTALQFRLTLQNALEDWRPVVSPPR